MRQLRHVVGFVEFSRINFVDAVLRHISLGSIVTLNFQELSRHLLHNPAANERYFCVLEPNISFAREIILALDTANLFGCAIELFVDELRRKCASRC
jgi:hypothetical protein